MSNTKIREPERYLRSIADEILSQTNQVRDIIGKGHWLSDGHHISHTSIDRSPVGLGRPRCRIVLLRLATSCAIVLPLVACEQTGPCKDYYRIAEANYISELPPPLPEPREMESS